MQGNAQDTDSNVVFKNIKATAGTAHLRSSYTGIRVENVAVNGGPLIKKQEAKVLLVDSTCWE